MEKIMGADDVERDRQKDTMIGSPSSEGKMVIKLKIPKLAAAMEGEKSSEVMTNVAKGDVIGSLSTSSLKVAKEGETMNQGKRVCPECKKEFSSGKALGGHMRVHVQAANRNTFLKPSKTTKFKKAYHDFNNDDENLKLIDTKKEQQQQRKPYSTSCVNDEGKPTCSLCGKIFPSMKSLYGHMRCHPERVWRGILPPPNIRTLVGTKPSSSACASSSSSLSENGLSINEQGSNIVNGDGDQVVDLTKFLRGWRVTERRGRRTLKAADEDEVLREAVEDLMSLAHGDPSMAESDVTQRQLRVEVFEGTNSNSLTNKDKIDEQSPSTDLREKDSSIIGLVTAYGKGKAVMEEEIEGKPPSKMEIDDGGMIKNFSDNESDSRNTNEQLLINYKCKKNSYNSPYKSPNKIKKRKKMKLMMELEQGFHQEMVGAVVAGGSTPPPPLQLPMASPPEQPAITESKYKCTTCNKSFTSHQALGGHRSSHNKSKITSTDHHQVEEGDYESFVMNQSGEIMEKEVEFAADAMVAPGSTSNSNSNSSIHQCKICDKIFPTGQALGGHKRCHWTGTTEAQAPSSQVTSTGEAASQTGGGRKVLDFDLNEVPPMLMEDEAGSGHGYASSSYNSNMG